MTKIEFIDSDVINDILDSPSNVGYKSLLVKTISKLSDRNFLDFDSTISEIEHIENTSIRAEDYEIDYDEVELYGRLVGDVDQIRSRLSDLLSKSSADLILVNEYYELLLSVWVGKYSELKSVDKREGEGKEILAFLLDEKIRRKELYEIIKNKFYLMNSKLESLSRKITIKIESAKHFKGQYLEYPNQTVKSKEHNEDQLIEDSEHVISDGCGWLT
jgi:hypothetical protein